jgi:hypothetical protein
MIFDIIKYLKNNINKFCLFFLLQLFPSLGDEYRQPRVSNTREVRRKRLFYSHSSHNTSASYNREIKNKIKNALTGKGKVVIIYFINLQFPLLFLSSLLLSREREENKREKRVLGCADQTLKLGFHNIKKLVFSSFVFLLDT